MARNGCAMASLFFFVLCGIYGHSSLATVVMWNSKWTCAVGFGLQWLRGLLYPNDLEMKGNTAWMRHG